MWMIIVVAILLIVAALIVIIRPGTMIETDQRDPQTHAKLMKHVSLTKTAWVPFIVALLFVLTTSWTQVHAKEEGVGVAFGRPVASYGAGLHLKPFWQSVTKINETVYTDSYGTKGADNPALPVRLGDGNAATVASSIRWHVNPDAVDYIYATYRSNDPSDQLRKAVVDTQYQAIMNQVFSKFNPTSVVQNINLKDPLQASRALNFSPDYSQMASDITTQMTAAVKDSDGTPLVIIDKITVAGITYSAATEARISSLVQQAAATQKAVQLEATNTALNDANQKLKNSLSGKNGILYIAQQCMTDLADGKIQNQPGFSCWPGGSSGVVIPGTK